MANTSYDSLTSLILTEVQGCSDPLAEQAIRDAVVEFCQRSRIWIYTCDPADVEAGEPAYDFDIPQGAALVQPHQVRITGCEPLLPRTTDQLDGEYRDWTSETGTPKYYTQLDDDVVMVVPTPDANRVGGLKIMLILKPSRASTGFPGWIDERYQEGILAGAKAKLMAKQGNPWYSPDLATFYQNQFDEAIGNARGDAAGSLVRAPLRTTSQN